MYILENSHVEPNNGGVEDDPFQLGDGLRFQPLIFSGLEKHQLLHQTWFSGVCVYLQDSFSFTVPFSNEECLFWRKGDPRLQIVPLSSSETIRHRWYLSPDLNIGVSPGFGGLILGPASTTLGDPTDLVTCLPGGQPSCTAFCKNMLPRQG